jgi:hypothetical protein
MPVNISNTELSHSFNFLRLRLNDAATALSTKAITVNSNAAVGDATVTGTFRANTLYTDTITGGNSSVNGAITFTQNTAFTGKISVTGSANLTTVTATGLVNLGAGVIVTGMANVSANLNVSGALAVTGNLSAARLSGIGTSLTALNASAMTSGTVANARISGDYTGFANLTASGTITANKLVGDGTGITGLTSAGISFTDINATGNIAAVAFSGSAAGLTSIPAGQLTGTVPNTLITGTYTGFTAIVASGAITSNSSSAVNSGNGSMRHLHTGGVAYLQVEPNSANNAELRLTRFGTSGTPIDKLILYASNTTVSGNLLITGIFDGNGTSITSLNATQLTTGTVPSARIAGAYTGITDIGTLNTTTTVNVATASDGIIVKSSTAANATSTTRDSPNMKFVGKYWAGVDTEYAATLNFDVTANTPFGKFTFDIGASTDRFAIDQGGNIFAANSIWAGGSTGSVSTGNNAGAAGYTSLNIGSSTRTGFIGFYYPGGTRGGYIGFANNSAGSPLNYTTEAGTGYHNFNTRIHSDDYIDSGVGFRGTTSDSAVSPSFAWNNDPDTGFFRADAGVIGVSLNSTEFMRFGNTSTFGHFLSIGANVASLSTANGTAYGIYHQKFFTDPNGNRFGFKNDVVINDGVLTGARQYKGYDSVYINQSLDANSTGGVQNSDHYGFYMQLLNSSSGTLGATRAGDMTGVSVDARSYSSANVSTMLGVIGQVQTFYNGSISVATGVSGLVRAGANTTVTGGITSAYGVRSQVYGNTAAAITTGIQYYGQSAGNIANSYGLYLTGEERNYISGQLGVGQTVPAANVKVHITGNTYINVTGSGALTVGNSTSNTVISQTAITIAGAAVVTNTALLATLGAVFTAGAIGSVVYAKVTTWGNTFPINYGTTIPGSQIVPSDSAGGSGSAQSGTWMCTGRVAALNNTTTFIRIA